MVADSKLVWVTNVHQQELTSGSVRFVNDVQSHPQAAEKFSEEQLGKMGYVGIYKREGDAEFQTIQRRLLPSKTLFPRMG
jgi:hypothetical protein